MYFDSVYDEKDVESITGKKIIEFPDDLFEILQRDFNLNKDDDFIKFLRVIDECDIPLPNVARDIETGETHSFDKVSSGVKMLWLIAKFSNKYIFPTCWLGENCYQSMFDLGSIYDFDVYEDSNMFAQEYCIEECTGKFKDYKTGDVVTIDNDNGWDYVLDHHYN
jgi:hypothetical protein